MKARTRLSSKGQVVIPEPVRRAQRWKAGTEFFVEEDGASVRLRPVAAEAAPDWESLIGCAGYRGPRKSIAAMRAAIAREALKHL